MDAEVLNARLAEIEATAAGPVDALEPLLRAILETTGASAGALCLYDQRRELLRLAAEIDLSDEGCHRLRTVRRADPNSWDMPLQSLKSRRAYLIERAAKNRYVPPLVEDTTKVSTVACLPLYAGRTPLGSIILVTLVPRVFGERDIVGLDQPLRALGRMIEALRRREAAAIASLAPAPVAPPPAAVTGPSRGPRSGGPPAHFGSAEDSARIASLTAALEGAQREQARLALALEEAETERAKLAQTVREGARAVDHDEIDRLRARLAEAEAGAAHEQRAREELEASLDRGVSIGQHDLRTALEKAQRAEAARAALVAENARLSVRLEQLSQGAAPHEVDADRMEINRLRARLAEAEAGAAHEQRAREELEAALARGLSAGQHDVQVAIEAARRAEAAHAAVVAQNSRLSAELEQLRAAEPRDETHAERMEIDRLRARLAEAEAGAAHEQRAREELQTALDRGLSTGQHDLEAALEALREAEAVRAVSVAENVRLAAEVERLSSAAARVDSVTEALAAMESGRAQLAAALAAAEAARAEEAVLRGTVEERAAVQRAEIERLEARLAEAPVPIVGDLGVLDQDLHEQAAELRRALDAARAAEEERAAAISKLAAARSELTRAQAGVEALQKQTARAHQDIERLAEERRAARAEGEQFVSGLRKAHEREVEALRAEHAAVVGSASALGAESGRLRAAMAALEAERDRLTADVQGAAAARAHLEQALTQGLQEARAREDELDARLTTRERDIEALRAEHTAEAAGAAARLDALAGEADQLRATMAALTAERDRLAADVEGTAAARARLEDALAQGLEEARAREHEITERLQAREADVEALRAEHEQEASASATRLEQLGVECDQLRESTGTLEAERGRLAAEAEGAKAARARLDEALASAVEEGRAREQELSAQLEAHGRELEALRAERAAEAVATAAQVETLRAECDRLREALTALESEGAQAAAEVEEAAPEPVAPEEEPAPETAPAEPAPPEAAAPGAAPPEAAPAERAAPPRAASGDGPIVMLGGEPAWVRAAGPGAREVVVLEARKGLAAELAPRAPARVIVNLVSRGSLEALLSLRAGKFSDPFWGCLTDPATGRTLPIGMIEPAARPFDPNAVIAAVGTYAKRGARIVTVGDDVDALVSLRHGLAREGMSVSMAWNGKQAAELLPMVRPAIVVLDMELPGRDGGGVVAQLALMDPIPTLVIIPGTGDPAAEFATALADPAYASSVFPIAQFLKSAAGTGGARHKRPG